MPRGMPLLLIALIAAAGCARYRPSPVDPADHLRAYRARSLEDPALTTWVARHAGAPTGGRWTPGQLAVAALALRADVEAARRAWVTAGAATGAAGARPPVGAAAGLERAVSGAGEDSPWVVSLTALLTLETGGKRGARLLAARAERAVAESELLLTAQDARHQVRSTALALLHAEEERADALRALEGLEAVATLERGRFQEAALGSAEMARTAADVALARADVASAEREAAAARAALAGALAVPPAATRALVLAPTPAGGCAWADSLGTDSLLGLAARRRGEVTRALARYAAADAELRLQVARQRPDLELGPGFIFDQGIHRWTLGVALPALLGFRNRAPIEQAEAARASAASEVHQSQETVLAEVGNAVQACESARRERSLADSLGAAAAGVGAVARARYERGEAGRLEGARAELALLRAAAVRRAADRRLAQTGIAVEAAVAAWRDDGVTWPDPRQPPEIGEQRQ